jgi:hypothetical protein
VSADQHFGLYLPDRFGQLFAGQPEFFAQPVDCGSGSGLVVADQLGRKVMHPGMQVRNDMEGFNNGVALAVGAVLPVREAAGVLIELRAGRCARGVIEVAVHGAHPALVVDSGDQ